MSKGYKRDELNYKVYRTDSRFYRNRDILRNILAKKQKQNTHRKTYNRCHLGGTSFFAGQCHSGNIGLYCDFQRDIIHKKAKACLFGYFPILLFLPLVLTYKNITSLIPPIASTLATFGFYCKNVRLIKVFAVLVSVLMLTYAIFNNSLAAAVNEHIVLSSLAISEIKVYIEKNSRYITVSVDDKGDIKK